MSVLRNTVHRADMVNAAESDSNGQRHGQDHELAVAPRAKHENSYIPAPKECQVDQARSRVLCWGDFISTNKIGFCPSRRRPLARLACNHAGTNRATRCRGHEPCGPKGALPAGNGIRLRRMKPRTETLGPMQRRVTEAMRSLARPPCCVTGAHGVCKGRDRRQAYSDWK